MIGPIRLTPLTARLNAASVSGILLDDSQSCAVVVVGGYHVGHAVVEL